MNFVLFYHSLVSDWNHGNAHFLRGIASELQRCGHDVRVLEPAGGWSVTNLLTDHGTEPLARFHRTYPGLRSEFYVPASLDVAPVLEGADVVIVHEWTDREVVARIGRHRRRHGGYRLLFHDTHHRAVTAPDSLPVRALEDYDGVLAFGDSLREIYLSRGWAERAWVWHEAADHRRFRPLQAERQGDLVWIGNWGDGERRDALEAFLLEPVRRLGLSARVHGVRYPPEGREALARAGIGYAGWLPNFAAPKTMAAFGATVHVPRRPYVESLPGVPTIRVFEALACGIPLVCAPWDDSEGLFTEGDDYLVARNTDEMVEHLRMLVHDTDAADRLSDHGRRTIEAAHTCAHRVLQLMGIVDELRAANEPPTVARATGTGVGRRSP